MNSGAQVANEEMFRRELLAKLDRIIELLEKNQAVEHTLALDGLKSWGNFGKCTICGKAWEDCSCIRRK